MSRGTAKLWMVLDGVTIFGAAALATLYKMRIGPLAGAQGFWHGTLIYGTEPVSLPSLAAGFVWDSRDSEIFPRSGMLHEVGVRGERGVPFDSGVKYLEAGGIFRGYVPLGPAVLAAAATAESSFAI